MGHPLRSLGSQLWQVLALVSNGLKRFWASHHRNPSQHFSGYPADSRLRGNLLLRTRATAPDADVKPLRYVARQPIFDREQKVFGYELLFREE